MQDVRKGGPSNLSDGSRLESNQRLSCDLAVKPLVFAVCIPLPGCFGDPAFFRNGSSSEPPVSFLVMILKILFGPF